MPTPISRDELRAALAADDPPVLIEALGAAYYADAHLPGAINIPPGHVDRVAHEFVPDTESLIVVYCIGGDSARLVARRLSDLGYGQVRVYEGGKQDWVGHGLPVERAAGEGVDP